MNVDEGRGRRGLAGVARRPGVAAELALLAMACLARLDEELKGGERPDRRVQKVEQILAKRLAQARHHGKTEQVLPGKRGVTAFEMCQLVGQHGSESLARQGRHRHAAYDQDALALLVFV